MDFDARVKLAIYRFTARTGSPPQTADLADELESPAADIGAAYARLEQRRLLVLESDGLTIRMAPPFSGVPTQHLVHVGDVDYYANCAWDALGIPAALRARGEVRSRCEQSRQLLRLRVELDGPEETEWLFHCQVPAAHWWRDIVFT